MTPPPLSLYVHLPWCVRKCPYCDFNSHALRGEIAEAAYIDALLRDLAFDAPLVSSRTVQTIFIGGGTPSLFSPESIARLLDGIRARVSLAPEAEITLEANPGTVELARFRGFREAGVNRLSIGIQSFDDGKLQALGRIHGSREARAAAEAARAAGVDNFNLDIMYGLPEQDIDQAQADIATAIALAPSHISAYQLTLEPNTLFYRQPPALPDDETIGAMHEALVEQLAENGYAQYEVSAYARPGRECRHNRNYWEFGDYLGIGAGAHAKLTSGEDVVRFMKPRHPDAYTKEAGTETARTQLRTLAPLDRCFEFMLNALRLTKGVSIRLFSERTGLSIATVEASLQQARARGLLKDDPDMLLPTPLGRRFLNDLVAMFLPKTQ